MHTVQNATSRSGVSRSLAGPLPPTKEPPRSVVFQQPLAKNVEKRQKSAGDFSSRLSRNEILREGGASWATAF